jgi:S1-C subfamily serine protease
MKTNPTLLASALALAIIALTPAQADIKEAARKLHDESNSALVGIKGLLKIDVTMNGQPAGNQESPIWGNGLVIADGMVVTAYQTLVPDVAAQAKGGGVPAGVEIKTRLNEIKFVDESGEEYDAKLILHDEDLDLAFLAIDPKAENADAWEVAPVGITGDPEAGLLDEVIGLARQSSTLRFASAVKTGEVISVVKRPRLLYAVQGVSPGEPAFVADGTFLGIVTLRKSTEEKQAPIPVILPAKYIRKLVPQALEKQEELKTAEPEEKEDEPEEPKEEDKAKDKAEEEGATPAPEGADPGSEDNETPAPKEGE